MLSDLDLLHNLTKRSTITSGILSTDSDFLGSFSLLFFRSEWVVGARSYFFFGEEEEEEEWFVWCRSMMLLLSICMYIHSLYVLNAKVWYESPRFSISRSSVDASRSTERHVMMMLMKSHEWYCYTHADDPTYTVENLLISTTHKIIFSKNRRASTSSNASTLHTIHSMRERMMMMMMMMRDLYDQQQWWERERERERETYHCKLYKKCDVWGFDQIMNHRGKRRNWPLGVLCLQYTIVKVYGGRLGCIDV